MHFTFTDLVDNVSSQSVGDRKGDNKNDRFLYSSFSLNYDLSVQTEKEAQMEKAKDFEDDGEGPLVLDMTDLDKDGVRDFDDECLNTPPGVPVDGKGCPLDKDKDYVPDYMDDERPTPKGNYVDEKGVTLTDEDFERRYLEYKDSTGQYHGGYQKVDREEVVTSFSSLPKNNVSDKPRQNLTYFVVLGTEKKQISANELYKYLGQKDFRQIESGDTVFYVIGHYENIADALERKQNLEKDGIKTNGIGEHNRQEGNAKTLSQQEIDQRVSEEKNRNNPDKNPNDRPPVKISGKDEVIYRVQIGAFDKKLSQKVFKDVPDLLSIAGPDDKVRYYSGSFNSLEQAADRKLDLVSKGFESAFIVAYKNNEKISLKDAGAELANNNPENTTDNHRTKVDPERVKFKVQVGAFRNDIPAKVLDVFLQLGNIQLKRNDSGLTVYLVGEENTYEAADALKKKVVEMGIGDAFVVGEFNGSIIPAQEAQMLKDGK
jgi:cell division protein FtsN